MKSRAIALASALLLLAVVSSASGAPLGPTADAKMALYDGPSHQQGVLSLLHIDGSAYRDVSNVAAWPWLEGTASHVRAVHFSRERTEVSAGPLTPGADGEPVESEFETDDGVFRITKWQTAYIVNIYGDATIDFEARQTKGQYLPLPSQWMDEGGIREASTDSVGDADYYDFTRVKRNEDAVVHQIRGQDFLTTLRGNFTMEIRGWDLHVEGADGSRDLTSGIKEGGTGPTGGDLPGPLRFVTTEFLRLEFTEAVLRLQIEGGTPFVQSAFYTATLLHEADLRLEDVAGTIGSDDISPDGLLQGGVAVSMASSMHGDNARLDIARAPVSQTNAPGPLAAVAVALPGVLLLGIPAMLGLGVLVYLLRREHLPTDLKTVEALLEKGRYAQAASIAGRILKYHPGKEDAIISRAVALSKDQRHGKVIDEVERHLKVHEPTDGVLHYVLGLSYLDLGRQAPGENALHEAVRLTPGLRPEVTARLGVPPPVHHQEAHGYA